MTKTTTMRNKYKNERNIRLFMVILVLVGTIIIFFVFEENIGSLFAVFPEDSNLKDIKSKEFNISFLTYIFIIFLFLILIVIITDNCYTRIKENRYKKQKEKKHAMEQFQAIKSKLRDENELENTEFIFFAPDGAIDPHLDEEKDNAVNSIDEIDCSRYNIAMFFDNQQIKFLNENNIFTFDDLKGYKDWIKREKLETKIRNVIPIIFPVDFDIDDKIYEIEDTIIKLENQIVYGISPEDPNDPFNKINNDNKDIKNFEEDIKLENDIQEYNSRLEDMKRIDELSNMKISDFYLKKKNYKKLRKL